MNFRWFRLSFIEVALSLVCAGVFYSVWLSAFLMTAKLGNSTAEIILWLFAPVATAAGFAAGIIIFERLAKRRRGGFLGIFIWPLLGCAIGFLAIYSFGPMLIVFGMFALGTASVALREVVLTVRRDRDTRIKG